MARAIWKYPLYVADEPQPIQVPAGGTVVHVAAQDGIPCVWIDVDTDRPTTSRRFVVEGTGHPVHEGVEYLGTAHAMYGLVWHIFEIPD